MQLTAKLIQILPLQTGNGKNGEWKKQDIIVDTEAQYPKKICISVCGDKINASQLIVSKKLKINFYVASREYNSRWYTDRCEIYRSFFGCQAKLDTIIFVIRIQRIDLADYLHVRNVFGTILVHHIDHNRDQQFVT